MLAAKYKANDSLATNKTADINIFVKSDEKL